MRPLVVRDVQRVLTAERGRGSPNQRKPETPPELWMETHRLTSEASEALRDTHRGQAQARARPWFLTPPPRCPRQPESPQGF